ncbi:DNA processing protein [Alkalibacterium subtropicum]|uniref:DNA processing protein n=1 Tax=Alkalibacterium subtropicum TaxID=753702 RepID=A0A1I1KYI2_9LACT|nr:DNA-processing protein DprA [Alkalibacterium subtropicum]SFC63768.1 DNA processing protein [Alkalibacterium subtropicum]
MQTIQIEDYLYALAYCPFLSHKEKWKILISDHPEFSDYTSIYDRALAMTFQKKTAFRRYLKAFDYLEAKEEEKEAGIHTVYLGQADYPYVLKKSYEPPLVLFYKGDFSLVYKGNLSIVGARDCTEYGQRFLKELLPSLVSHELVTVSGLARGIDTHVHTRTIENGGKTIAVLGNGIGYAYPGENKHLQEEISRNHLLLSEYPLNTPPKKPHFPLRNRIIAGLSRGVLVVEARERSGSLITARLALEEGRDVFAVPGSVFSEQSKGCLDLIKAGAILCQSCDDILSEWHMTV